MEDKDSLPYITALIKEIWRLVLHFQYYELAPDWFSQVASNPAFEYATKWLKLVRLEY